MVKWSVRTQVNGQWLSGTGTTLLEALMSMEEQVADAAEHIRRSIEGVRTR